MENFAFLRVQIHHVFTFIREVITNIPTLITNLLINVNLVDNAASFDLMV